MSSMACLGSVFGLTILLASMTSASMIDIPKNFGLANMTMFANVSCPMLLVASHYTEMGCQPGKLRNASFLYCPSDYNCSSLAVRPKAQCLYKGRTYEVNETLSSKQLRVRCRHSCVCRLDEQGFAGFVCKTRKCAVVDPSCRLTYANPMQCCPKAKCDTPKVEEAICQYRNKTYTAGEIMDSTFNNTRCICREGFDGEMIAPFCQPVQCGVELDYPKTMRRGCSPVYDVDVGHIKMGGDIMTAIFDFLRDRLMNLCPLNWACPTPNDVVLPLTSMAPDIPIFDSDSNCRYGNNDMSILDVAMSPEQDDGSCVMCICVVPPNLLCIFKSSCWSF